MGKSLVVAFYPATVPAGVRGIRRGLPGSPPCHLFRLRACRQVGEAD